MHVRDTTHVCDTTHILLSVALCRYIVTRLHFTYNVNTIQRALVSIIRAYISLDINNFQLSSSFNKFQPMENKCQRHLYIENVRFSQNL